MMLHHSNSLSKEFLRNSNLVTRATQVSQSLLDLHTSAMVTCSRATNMPSLERIATKEIFTARSKLFNFFSDRTQDSNNSGDQGMTPLFIREEEETFSSSLDSLTADIPFKVRAKVHESPGKTHLLTEETTRSRRRNE